MKIFFYLLFIFSSIVCFSQSRKIKIGDKYLGGKIAYIFKEGDPNFEKYVGIVCSDSIVRNQNWGCSGIQVIPINKLSTSSMIGYSFENQAYHLKNCKEGIGSFCNNLIINKENGWLIPTSKELMSIFENYSKLNIPLEPGKYWTNVDANLNEAIVVNNQFLGGRNLFTMGTQRKDLAGNIFPIKYILKGLVNSLSIDTVKNINDLVYGVTNFNLDIAYVEGNGGLYDEYRVDSKGVLGLTLTFPEGILIDGPGSITGLVSGIPSQLGIAEFYIYFGGQSLIYRLNITPEKPKVSILDCSNAKITGSFETGVSVWPNDQVFFASDGTTIKNINIKIPYKGGNGIAYESMLIKSKGVSSDITAVLESGILNKGDGELILSLNGKTPKNGTLIIPINFYGESGEIKLNIKHDQWMSENLNVNKFRNGDSIFQSKNVMEWLKANREGKPTWCYYRFDTLYKNKIYNWYAVSDKRGLAPEGWHIPYKEEWINLGKCFGGSDIDFNKSDLLCSKYSMTIEIEKLKSNRTDLYVWYPIETYDNSGFNALPIGNFEGNTGNSFDGGYASWWCYDFLDLESLVSVQIGKETPFCIRYFHPTYKSLGMSVRCIKD